MPGKPEEDGDDLFISVKGAVVGAEGGVGCVRGPCECECGCWNCDGGCR